MIGQGKLIGGILIGVGVVVAAILILYAFANGGSGPNQLTGGSVALVSGCGLLLGAILAGAGVSSWSPAAAKCATTPRWPRRSRC